MYVPPAVMLCPFQLYGKTDEQTAIEELLPIEVFAVTLTVEEAEPEHDGELTVYVYVPTPASAGLHVPPVAGVPPSAANS